MESCPYCNHDQFYTNDYVYGSAKYSNRLDGEIADNVEVYDYLSQKRGKIAYCEGCNKKLGKVDWVEGIPVIIKK